MKARDVKAMELVLQQAMSPAFRRAPIRDTAVEMNTVDLAVPSSSDDAIPALCANKPYRPFHASQMLSLSPQQDAVPQRVEYSADMVTVPALTDLPGEASFSVGNEKGHTTSCPAWGRIGHQDLFSDPPHPAENFSFRVLQRYSLQTSCSTADVNL